MSHSHDFGKDCDIGCPYWIAQHSEHQKQVLHILTTAQDTYEDRSSVYKDNYKLVGRTMAALFPEGRPGLKTEEDYNRWHIFELIIVKLTRYVVNFDEGHPDSLLDMIPYLGILGALDKEMLEKRDEEGDPFGASETGLG